MAVNASEPSSEMARLGVVATAVALGLIVTYLIFLGLQWEGTDAGDAPWSRRQELLKGVEALAFTAAGALLGTTVQRQATRQAEDRADRAETEAKRNISDAEKGRALQKAIEARSAVRGGRDKDPVRGAQPFGPGDSVLAELVELARLYDESG